MISLEQVRLLETKVAKAIDIVQRLSAQNAALTQEKNNLISKLDANQKRLDELEALIMSFKEDQGRIEDGIIAALDRLSQFEEAFENSLKDEVSPKKSAPKKAHSHSSDTSETENKKDEGAAESSSESSTENAKGKEFFEITEAEKSDDGELDIF